MATEVKCRFIIVACILLMPEFAMAGKEHSYANEIYGFRVSTTPGIVICSEQPPVPDHGFVVLLDGSECDSVKRTEESPRIVVYADYNSAYEASSLESLAKVRCRGMPNVSKMISPRSIGGLPTIHCISQGEEGKVTSILLAQRKSPGDDVTGWINYEVLVLTKLERVDVDMNFLDSLLANFVLE